MPPIAPLDAELLIEARWILPMSEGLPVLEHQAIAIDAGRLLGPWPIDEARRRVEAKRTLQLEHHALLPGLINAHNHAGMSLMRGYADDLPLMTWLNEHIWPAEAAHVTPDFVADGTRLAIAEMLRSGTTTFSDMYLAPEPVADAVEQLGIRAQLCTPLIDFPTPWAPDFHTGLERTEALVERYRNHSSISLAFGPHAPYTVADDSLALLIEARERLNLPIQMHVHETAEEVEQGLAKYAKRPLRRLHDAGLLGAHFQAVHVTQINDEDMTILRDSGTHVIHCPQSNLKLASGFCPVDRLQAAGINVALGTDGAASNNDLDMFDEMKSAALIAKAVSGNAAALPAMAALAMATRDGAKALGIAHRRGQLAEGFDADLIALDLDAINTLPLHHPASAIVYAMNSRQVSHVWVDGKLRVDEGQLVDVDVNELKRMAHAYQQAMSLPGQPGEAS
ncbi:TRZ/ATZ family hydrolase [Halomonas sp. McH1-25]|uniref:TRZ/ATZ family hydrolase n=1 Tax=unclassified Halomonas TaxID=2609666 RepID=UPI001EF515C3|nr:MULTISPECIES: TRZ/ATZ family hydrolase [unclassified Halomonas]MCG7598489.1 TRZ/ATZ family hydrolase [Halomonas sp. McH1-25]MCP1341741.1 TRZ/ATZ family hydrolase [Halomonas sp. FL8]MCP1361906.1 TRZ/ATZ family hydrolase [Halomonas sp. BBD45]MCP1364138.1 TRZ/ATZ family hydrolase [Halomonas sp. BBD48]